MILTKIYQKENLITEKFALLNLLKALNTLSSAAKPPQNGESEEPAPEKKNAPPVKKTESATDEEKFNAMASVLERHEEISNRVRNKK